MQMSNKFRGVDQSVGLFAVDQAKLKWESGDGLCRASSVTLLSRLSYLIPCRSVGIQDSKIRSESELRLAVVESIVEPVVDQLVILDVDLTVADLADSLT